MPSLLGPGTNGFGRVSKTPVSPIDYSAVVGQLGRPLRGEVSVAHRCPCGQPDVVATAPRLDDGSPFPTAFYLTCPRAVAAASTLESEGVMPLLQSRLESDVEFAAAYRRAHEDYLRRRVELGGEVAEIADYSAGGMPTRVKCLHALVAHSLAAGPGVNPVGDEVLRLLAERGLWPTDSTCVPRVVAAVDCGTNSIRLLIARWDPQLQALVDIERTMRVVRLGEGLEATGVISAAALERTFAAVDEYAAAMRAAGVGAVRFVATSASRDAKNRDDFVAGVAQRLGVNPEVISGDEEARLSFTGAVSSPQVAAVAATPRLVVDIGGGSTEFVFGSETPQASRSVDIGCVRLAERRLFSDPPTDAETAAVAADADAAIALAAAEVPISSAASLIGLAGTVTTVAAIAMGLPEYDADVLHGARISAADVHRVAAQLAGMTLAERLAMPVMHPGRADVIVSGATILSRIVTATGVDHVVVSERDILDGIAADVAAGAGESPLWRE